MLAAHSKPAALHPFLGRAFNASKLTFPCVQAPHLAMPEVRNLTSRPPLPLGAAGCFNFPSCLKLWLLNIIYCQLLDSQVGALCHHLAGDGP